MAINGNISIGFGESIQLARANTPFLSSNNNSRDPNRCPLDTPLPPRAPSSSSLSSHCWAPLSAAILHASRGAGGRIRMRIENIGARYKSPFRLSNYETTANLAKGISRLSIEISIPRRSLSIELLVQNRIASSRRSTRFTICFHRTRSWWTIDLYQFVVINRKKRRRDTQSIRKLKYDTWMIYIFKKDV